MCVKRRSEAGNYIFYHFFAVFYHLWCGVLPVTPICRQHVSHYVAATVPITNTVLKV